jgi:protein-tyrosine phosphatase
MHHFGVRHFIDLTEEGELTPYADLLPADCTHTRFPIRDVSVPKSMDEVERWIYRIQELSRRNDGYVYIHCWGGVGRTGTIVGCYLAEQMKEPTFENVLEILRIRFSTMPKSSHRITPETKEQEAFIAKYIDKMQARKSC